MLLSVIWPIWFLLVQSTKTQLSRGGKNISILLTSCLPFHNPRYNVNTLVYKYNHMLFRSVFHVYARLSNAQHILTRAIRLHSFASQRDRHTSLAVRVKFDLSETIKSGSWLSGFVGSLVTWSRSYKHQTMATVCHNYISLPPPASHHHHCAAVM